MTAESFSRAEETDEIPQGGLVFAVLLHKADERVADLAGGLLARQHLPERFLVQQFAAYDLADGARDIALLLRDQAGSQRYAPFADVVSLMRMEQHLYGDIIR